jgi:hypothetical protein
MLASSALANYGMSLAGFNPLGFNALSLGFIGGGCETFPESITIAPE